MNNSKVGGLHFRADCCKLCCVPRRKRDDPDRLALHSNTGELLGRAQTQTPRDVPTHLTEAPAAVTQSRRAAHLTRLAVD